MRFRAASNLVRAAASSGASTVSLTSVPIASNAVCHRPGWRSSGQTRSVVTGAVACARQSAAATSSTTNTKPST